ncbi:MAG: aspartate kinase [Rhodomicrobium sp.]|nr:aspartate kinase [Rhodomicrobium sp.]
MLLVMKFGGTSVADIERIRNSALHVKREVDAGNRVAIVVSAMAGHTNQLVGWTREAHPLHDAREYDAVVSSGEQITAGLMAIILQSIGIPARSWQGWQIPLLTDDSHSVARIDRIESAELLRRLEQGEAAVVAGFQGISPNNRITTLGRGGSDTSAVALASALNADRCDIYTDVDGVYTADPRIVPTAHRLSRVSYEEMLEMASQGAKVLQTRSVELAMARGVRVQVRSSFDPPESCEPARAGLAEKRGTLVCDETEMLEHHIVSGIAYAKDEAKITVLKIDDKPGVAASIFMPLAEANINVDMIVQNISEDGRTTDLTFTVAAAELPRALQVLRSRQDTIRFSDLRGDTDVVKVSVIGVGMRSHAGVAAQMFQALADKAINIQAISTSEIKISVLVGAAHTEAAVKTLHSLFGLDRS